MDIHITGSLPSPLYKGFVQKEHAESFLKHGIFMIRNLNYYRKIEDSQRKDEEEGEGKVEIIMERPIVNFNQNTLKIQSINYELGPVYFGTTSINPRYIMCFSGPQVDLKNLAKKYGQYILRINQPDILVHEITSYLEQHLNISDIIWLKCIQVRYDKHQLIERLPEPASEERIEMSFSQKNPKDSWEYENRIVVTLPLTTSNLPEYIRVELNKQLEYLEWVEDH